MACLQLQLRSGLGTPYAEGRPKKEKKKESSRVGSGDGGVSIMQIPGPSPDRF